MPETFNGEPACICHRCDNPSCLNPTHLFLGNRAENNHDMNRKGRRVDVRGEQHGLARITEADAKAILASVRQGEPPKRVAERHSVSAKHVIDIGRGKRWAHLSQP